MKLSELLSKNVISLYDGELLGYVFNAKFSPLYTKVKDIIIDFDDGVIESFMISLPTSQILYSNEDAIVVKNSSLVTPNNNDTTLQNPINSIAYLTNGKKLGTVTDIILKNNYACESFVVDGKYIEVNKLASFSKGIMIFYEENSNFKVSKYKPNIQSLKKTSQNTTIKSLPIDQIESQPEKDINLDTKKYEFNKKNALPKRKLSPTANILGKRTNQMILSTNGEVIAHENEIITEKIISQAYKYNKLFDLISNAK